MKPLSRRLSCLVFAAALAAGCAVDIPKQMASDPNLQAGVMDAIAGNAGMAGQMADKLLASDSTRAMLVDKVLAHGDAAQRAMMAVAKDPTTLDGVIGLAVQEPAMKEHVLTLLKGMEMAGSAGK
ncbi:MAG: hypothetical protein ABIS67_08645 [Candidatus Eisenbacteria bacterium]